MIKVSATLLKYNFILFPVGFQRLLLPKGGKASLFTLLLVTLILNTNIKMNKKMLMVNMNIHHDS